MHATVREQRNMNGEHDKRKDLTPLGVVRGAVLLLASLAASNVHADVTLNANGESGTVQVTPGSQVDLTVNATNCPGNADFWRDTWNDPDSAGLSVTGQSALSEDSPCAAERSQTFTAPDTAGQYSIEFISEYCSGPGNSCANSFNEDATTFDQSTVIVDVEPSGPFVGSGTGLTGDYCDRDPGNQTDPCTDSPDVSRVDATVDFMNGDADWPPDGFNDDHFSVRWTGEIQAQYSEDYTFHALHDDGVRIWVNGVQVIDQYADQDDSWTDSGTPVSLVRGERYEIIIEYYENAGDQDMTLAWSSASTPSRTTVPQSQLYPDGTTPDPVGGVQLEYRMDADAWDGTAGEVSDSSGNDSNGTARGGAQTDGDSPALEGDPGTCRYGYFDGNDDYVESPDLSDLLNGTATITFWIRTTQTGSDTGWQAPGIAGVEQQGGADDIFWGWIDASGRIGISVGNDYGAEQKSNDPINDGAWHHVALTRDADTGETQVIVDGDKNTGSSGTGVIGTAFSSIGRIEDTGGTPEFFEGNLDEVRIYDSVLDDSDIASIRNATHPCPAASGLLTEYRMDEDAWDGSSSEVTDETGNGHDGIAVGGASTQSTGPAIDGDPGTCGYGSFDGVDDGVEDGDAGNYLNGLDAVTLTAWVYNTANLAGNNRGIFFTGDPSSGQDNRLGIRYDTSGANGGGNNVLKAGIQTSDCADSSDCVQVETEPNVMVENQWQHVAMTWSSGGDLRVYVDGNDVTGPGTGDRNQGTGGTIDAVNGLRIGQGVKSERWQGRIDEFRIYGSELTQSDITGIRDATHPCSSGPLPACAADYAVYAASSLDVGDNVTVNGNTVTGSGNAINPDTGVRTDVDFSLPSFEPASFPAFDGPEVNAPQDGNTFSAGDYEAIESNNNQTITLDTSNGNDFRIEKFEPGDNATINLQSGRYFVDEMQLSNGTTLNVSGGVVELYIGSSFDAGDNITINDTGSADNLIVRMYDGSEFELGNGSDFTGTVYGPGAGVEFEANDNVAFTGGILTGGDVEFGNGSSINYTPVAESLGRQLAECDGATVDGYVVTVPGQGLTCVTNAVTINAQDSSGNAIDPPDDTVLGLSADTDKGTWSRVRSGSGMLTDTTSGDGVGSYTFPGDESTVVLSFDYPDIASDPESVTITVDDGSASGTSDPISISLAGFRFLDDDAGTAADTISGQIAAKPSDTGFGASNIGLQAVRASDEDPTTCEGVFDDGDTVSVEMGAECRDPDNCAGTGFSVNGTSIATSDDNGAADAPAGFDTVDLDFGANSTAPLTLSYADAGEMRLYARHEIVFDDPSGTPTTEYLRGASNGFVVRPFGFDVSAVGNPAATDANGGVYRVAGTDFTAEVAAVGWAAGDDSNDDGVPDGYDNDNPTDNADLANNVVLSNFGPENSDESVTVTSALWQPGGGSDPSLTGAPDIDEGAFEDGANVALGSAATTVQYPEVGIIELRAALADGDYLGTGIDVPGRSGPVGRFIPADFNQTATDGMFRNTCSATFTYLGETFGYQTGSVPELTITARNDGGQTTRNYTGTFAKLVAANVDRTGPTSDGSTNGSDGTSLAVIPDLQQGTLTDNGDGTLTYTFDSTDGYRYDRNIDRDGDSENDSRVGPFETDLTVTIDSIEDSDTVNAPAGNREDVTPDPASIRFGRLVIENAAGAEIAPVEQVIRAEYFAPQSGDQWVVNADDDGCTALMLAAPGNEVQLANDDDGDSPVAGDALIDVAGGTTSIEETGPVPLGAGTATLTFEAPGADNTGWVDTTVLLVGAEHPYLAIDDNGDGIWDADPTGRVTFGIYTGPSGRILLREIPAN